MKLINNLLLLSLYCCCCIFCFCSSIVFSNEASILLKIKSSLVDPLDHLKDWKLPENDVGSNASVHCSWTGVGCSSYGNVETLDLSNMNLSGKIPVEIEGLSFLSSLNLCCNKISSPLPRSLSNLTALERIDLSQNFFTGKFPLGLGMAAGLVTLNASGNNFSDYLPEDISNATSLESLDLRGNFFEGSIPKCYKNLVRLKFLWLSGNNITGQIPVEIFEMVSLESVILGYNGLEGVIPVQIGNLANLRYLDLAIGNLGGAIPAELGKLQQLNTVFLYQNNLEGRIPAEIRNMSALQLLDLSENMLSGDIPLEIAEVKNLQLLNLMSNQLSGSVPSAIAELAQLEVLELWNNSLSGHLPSNLGNNSALQRLDISSNMFSGPIPMNLCSRGNLSKLIMFNNGFSGLIPPDLSTCSSLVRVRIHNNLLSGMIPVGFGELGLLQRLEMANNRLTGQIPSDLPASTSLSFIDLSRNQLQSSLPFSIFSISSLQNFEVSNNSLTGEIPDQFEGCTLLTVLDLSSNHFTGNIPGSIASCEKMVNLNLGNNQLTGMIPKSIAMMPTLAVLDLSNNSLTGGIPENFGNSPALETINVSHNKLDGPVPLNGLFPTINPDDLAGNGGLCGGVLPPCSHNTPHGSKQPAKHIFGGWIIGISTVVSFAMAVYGANSLYKRWRDMNCFEERFETGNEEWPWRLMAFQRLRFNSNEIISCIKESNVIGTGATGTVYKAKIERLQTTLAVKKLWRSQGDLEMGGGDDDLVGEVKLLARLQHRNIVRMVGFLQNDREAMIIYEYMENGSLGEALHCKHTGGLLVDWVSRYNIALGVAQGIAYLHHDCHPPVIHRDLKPNNILLDENLVARIADFGLAKLMIKKNETVSVVAGSYGYIAPEYGYTLKVDEKSDVYSFGVVLMELVSGKKPLEPEFGESSDIVEWIRGKMKDKKSLEEALDQMVGNTRHVKEEMLLVLRISLLCTAKLPKDRPSMRDVLMMLGEAKPRRKGCNNNNNNNNNNNEGNANNSDKPVFSTSPANGLL